MLVELYRGGKTILGSDGRMWVDGRCSIETIKEKVNERNKLIACNFPHLVAWSFKYKGSMYSVPIPIYTIHYFTDRNYTFKPLYVSNELRIIRVVNSYGDNIASYFVCSGVLLNEVGKIFNYSKELTKGINSVGYKEFFKSII